MNKFQKYIMLFAAALMTLMLLFPPFHYVLSEGTQNGGYGFISGAGKFGSPEVNIGMLLMQWLVVGVVSVVGWIFFGQHK